MRNIDQEMANSVHQYVSHRVFGDDRQKQKYLSQSLKLGTSVHNAGLVGTFAYMLSKINDHRPMLEDLTKVLSDNQNTSPDQLLATLRGLSLAEYSLMTQKAILALSWFKKFSQIYFAEEPATEEN